MHIQTRGRALRYARFTLACKTAFSTSPGFRISLSRYYRQPKARAARFSTCARFTFPPLCSQPRFSPRFRSSAPRLPLLRVTPPDLRPDSRAAATLRGSRFGWLCRLSRFAPGRFRARRRDSGPRPRRACARVGRCYLSSWGILTRVTPNFHYIFLKMFRHFGEKCMNLGCYR